MKKTSLTLFEFQKRYQTEEDCLLAIEKIRWSKGFVCPKCGHDAGYRLSRKRKIECAVCKSQASITAGTIFHKTRVPLVNWFWIIFLVAQDKGGASALRLAKQLGMYYKTVWHILQKIRKAMSGRDNSVVRLAGLIELDEGHFGGKHRKAQVIVAIEKTGKWKAGKLIMKRVFGKVISEPEVKRIVNAHVDNDSQQYFVTDCAAAHRMLEKMGHKLESHPSTPESAAQHLPLVHLAISLAKTFILGTYHGVSRKHLQKYLDEFCYRFNRRFKESQLHESLIRACILASPISYPALRV
jgi:predicted RNA-binding Zn-ribbon protein involved in translation (DUF1610 family)/transposase-like protein